MDEKKVKINDCGCSIDELLSGKSCGERAENKKENDRLCSAYESDFEVFVDPDVEKVSHDFYLRKLTDGLPVIPPTRERVNRFLKYTDMEPDEVVAVLPPLQGRATIEKIAINSVMAGCIPQFMGVVQHAVSAVSRERFNLAGVNATTHPVSICTILNGPVSMELSVNSGVGCLGPGNIANATIGRALRLCLMNIAGAVPGVGDHATMGSPAKYSYCFREAEEESPWDPLHVDQGFKEDMSTVTVMAAEAPQNVNDHRSRSAEDLLDTIVHTAATAGCNNSHVPGELLVVMSPEHARTVSEDGWNKEDVKNYIHENTAVPVDLADRGGRKLDPQWVVGDEVRLTPSPIHVVVVVAGGAGRHTMIAHSFGTSSHSVTLPLTFKNGNPIVSIEDLRKG
jgi:hypothetical protein